jgi:ferrous-iron efflux pump FieF
MNEKSKFSLNENDKLVKNATIFSVIAAVIILLFKLIGWYKTDSVTIFAAMIDSFLDIAASLFNFFAVKYALQPPDKNHRFGYNKITDLAVLSQSSFFCLSGIVVIIMSVKKIIHPVKMNDGNIGILLMVATIIVTLILVIYQKHVMRKTNSNIIAADNLHYLSDLVTNLGAILSIWISTKYNFLYIDPIFGILIALYIFYGSWKLLKPSFERLIDKEVSSEDKAKIINVIEANKKVRGFHDLKTRLAGNKAFIQVHLEMDGNLSLYDSHDIVHEIEKDILNIMPDSEIIIHQDPCGIEEKILYKD